MLQGCMTWNGTGQACKIDGTCIVKFSVIIYLVQQSIIKWTVTSLYFNKIMTPNTHRDQQKNGSASIMSQ